jgi:hypothetical protein
MYIYRIGFWLADNHLFTAHLFFADRRKSEAELPSYFY